ncbi:MAG: succinate dehydrogenase cytochrome b subunit [Myxococcota bacterium]
MARSAVWTSTIGLKVAMAVSGAALVGFVLAHMLGNLQIFAGPEVFNAYAHFMQGLGGLLWVARLGLLGMLVVHVGAAVMLSRRNFAARPQRYASLKARRTTPYAKAMLYTGIVVLAYVAYHLAHFTLGMAHPDYFYAVDELGRRDVYTNFVISFENPIIAGTYIVANVALAAHLAHATTSMFRSVGLSVGRFKEPLAKVGPAVGLVVGLGNVAMPLACWLGVISV